MKMRCWARVCVGASLALFCLMTRGQILINWNDPLQHEQAEDAYFALKEDLFREFEDEVRHCEYNARILGWPVVDVLRQRVDQLTLEVESMVRITLRETRTCLRDRERDILRMRKLIVLLRRELDRRR